MQHGSQILPDVKVYHRLIHSIRFSLLNHEAFHQEHIRFASFNHGIVIFRRGSGLSIFYLCRMFVVFLAEGSTFFRSKTRPKTSIIITSLSNRQVDLKDFPKLHDLQIRDSFNIDNARIESGGRNAVEGVASSVDTSANEAINEATSAASSMIQAQVHDLKSHLPRYYLLASGATVNPRMARRWCAPTPAHLFLSIYLPCLTLRQ